ncbi:inositol 1,4,5-triphosphate receptor associated 2 [Rhynchocyon petersi]
MATAGKGPGKQHNPVESICRKIKAIRKRETISNPMQQIVKYQPSSFDSSQKNTKKDFKELLKTMAATHVSTPYSHSSGSEKKHVSISSPQTVSLRTPPASHLHSPENITYSVILAASESIPGRRSQSSQNHTSLLSQSRKGDLSNKDLNSCSKNNLSILTCDFESTSDEISECFMTQESVVKKLFLSEEGWKVETNDGRETAARSVRRAWEEELLTTVFHACDTKQRGSVGVAKIIDYLRQTTHRDSEDSGLEELRSMLDPKKRDPQVDMETFHAIMKEWMAYCRNKREMSDWMNYIADLHFSKQKLEEENNQFKLASEVLEEANIQLSENCIQLQSQIKSAHQAIMRTNLLKEELEELKMSTSATEEQKSMIAAQNKQLETENQALILEIQSLQEENTKNILDIDRLEKKIEELSKTEAEHQVQLHTYEMILLNSDASLKKRELHIEELKSTIVEYRNITENLRGDKNKLTNELQHLQQELIVNGIQLNVNGEHDSIISKEENFLHCELTLAESAAHEEISEIETFIDLSLRWITNSEIPVKEEWEKEINDFKRILGEQLNLCVLMLDHLGNYRETIDKAFVKLMELLKRFKLEYFILKKESLCREKQLETIKQLQDDVVNQEAIFREALQEVRQQCKDAGGQVKDQDQAACSAGKEAKSLQHKSEEAISEQWNLQAINTELWDTCQTLEQKTRRLKNSSSEILTMASGDLERSLCHKEEDNKSVSPVVEIEGASPVHDSIPPQGPASDDKAIVKLEAKKEPETMEEHRKACAAGDTAVSPLPVTTVKSVNFRQSDNISANEKEVEAEFLRLSLGFKCDWFTLEKRVKLEQRSRDLAEENLKTEITNCLKLLESLTPLCEEDNRAQEIIKKLEKSITFLSQCTVRIASRAEMLGAINQESRVSKAVEVMIQHVENLKRMYAKEHAELEELKQVLLQNERSFNSLGDEDDCQVKKRSASLNSKPSSLRRVTIASLPRNIGNAGMVAGLENNDRFSRRSSSWRMLGSKQSEHRPSLHRFISTYSWADAEEEKREPKTKEESEPPEEEIVERTRKPSLSEKKNTPSKWEVSAICDTITSWATNLKMSFRKANKALWGSVAFIVLFAALMSFLTGLFFQKPVDAAPTQNGDSWISLEYALWPFTRLQHNGPPPV